jgi:micrococcal nuclease
MRSKLAKKHLVRGCAGRKRKEYAAQIIGISDGDTITVLRADRTQQRIRLHGIDAPEIGQEFGSRAKQTASELPFGKLVVVIPRDVDRYGRSVADVTLPDGRLLNREMVRRGMAWWYRRYAPNSFELANVETDAKTARVGIWSQSHPDAPWDWRKIGAAPPTAIVVGNRKSRIYHAAYCHAAATIDLKNRVEFTSGSEAEKGGFRRTKDCW